MLTFEVRVSGAQAAEQLIQNPEEFYYFLRELVASGPDVIVPLLREALEYGDETDAIEVAYLMLSMSDALIPPEAAD